MRVSGLTICVVPILVLAGHAEQVFSRPPRESFSPRWPDKTVLTPLDTSGGTWRQTGTVPTAYRNARADIQKRFLHQGCVLEKNVRLNTKPGQRRELTVWRWKKDKVLVMISELSADRTDLAWGMIPRAAPSAPVDKRLAQRKHEIK
ncbi:MAG: hypothetical protein RRC34_02590 [Lentisphaeria bacterium]|nr:hypothetical protein [Lentisphaeria bacterium]